MAIESTGAGLVETDGLGSGIGTWSTGGSVTAPSTGAVSARRSGRLALRQTERDHGEHAEQDHHGRAEVLPPAWHAGFNSTSGTSRATTAQRILQGASRGIGRGRVNDLISVARGEGRDAGTDPYG